MELASRLGAELAANAPSFLFAVACVAATFLFVKHCQTKGCPFAGGATQKPGAAGAAKMAATQAGSLRLTLEQLKAYDGQDASRPLYIAVRGKIYDVSAGRSFYGPGGPYAVFAGRECARALAFMKVTAEDCSDDLTGATESQLQTLADWEAKFVQKYGVAGHVVPS